MKNKKSTFSIFTFAAGVISGILLIGIYSFTTETPIASQQENSEISVGKAHDMFLRYYNSATISNERFKGFSVNRNEFNAIQALFFKDPTLDGCRIYLGKDQNQNNARIVVGVKKNKDVVASGIYKTPALGSDPCPTACDAASAIVTVSH